MSFCSKCGKQIPDTAKFCTGCGIPLLHSNPALVETKGIKSIDIKKGLNETLMLSIKKKKGLNIAVILTLILIILIIVCLSFF